MKIKNIIIASIVFFSSLFLYACNSSTEEVKIYNTTDLHSHFTKQMKNEIKKIDRKNSILIDAGDTVDIQTVDDSQWSSGEKSLGYLDNIVGGNVVEKIKKPMEGLSPISKELVNAKYDAAVLGNHEFYLPPDALKDLIYNYKKNGLNILSANTFFNKEYINSSKDERISEPYVIKEVPNKSNAIKIAVVGVTTNTINEEEAFKDGKEKFSDDVYIQNNPNYKGKFYMTDMVDESIKVVKEVKEKENPDMIILVAHSGEKPKIPRHSGNRIQELAKKVPYVDLIIAGHTHEFIDQHEYTGPNGKKVVVTQSGRHSKGLGESIAKFKFKDNKWKLESIKSKNIKFKTDKNDSEDADFDTSKEENRKKIGFNTVSEEKFRKLVKDNKNVVLKFNILSDKKISFPKDSRVILEQEYFAEKENEYIYYLTTRDLDLAKKYTQLYSKK